MSDAPPPYPGINAPFYQPPPNTGFVNPQQQYGHVAPPYPGAPQNGPPQQFGNAPPYPGPPQNGTQQQQFGGSATYPGAAAASGSAYPTLPSQPFGFNAPSAPSKCFKMTVILKFLSFNAISVTKEQEAAASAFYDPRNPNSAFVHNPQNFSMPPSYDSLNQNNDPNNKKTQ
jgi:hypothetical protein